MTVVASSMVAANSTPLPGDLWEPVALALPNWRAPIELGCAYRTVIEGSRSAAETRFSLSDKPGRTLSYSLGSYETGATQRLRAILHRAARARTPVPLWCDQTKLTGLVAGSTYNGTFTDRRFQIGGWFVAIQHSDSGITGEFEFRKITGVTASTITLDAPLSGTYANAYAYPVLECQLELNLATDAITDIVNTGQITFTESAGAGALEATVPSGTFSATLFDGYPILPLPLQWVETGVGTFRLGERSQVGISTVVQLFGSSPGSTFTLSFTGRDRAESMDIVRFFDGLRGRARAFWLANPSTGLVLENIGAGADTLFLAAPTSERDWDGVTHLSVFRISTGTVSVHSIETSLESGGQHILTIDPPLPSEVVADYLCSTAHLVRSDSDESREQWLTDHVLSTSWSLVELLRETDADATLADICGPGGGPGWEPNGVYVPCDGYCGELPGCVICNEEYMQVTVNYYYGQCHPLANCDLGCTLGHSCVLLLPFKSCIGPIIRWENAAGTVWVELDTDTTVWTYDISGVPCLPVVDQGGGPCLCYLQGTCNALPDTIITATCEFYKKEDLCEEYGSNPDCHYITTLLLEVVSLGPECT